MRIGCLQLAPALGKLEENMATADKILDEAEQSPLSLRVDLLVLPEMAFTGKLGSLDPFFFLLLLLLLSHHLNGHRLQFSLP